MRNYDRLFLLLDAVAVLLGQNVNFALVETKLAHVSLQEEDVSALHAGVQDL